MMFTEIDLQCEDLTWFAIDQSGHILVFYSGGYGNVPEFVCRSRVETVRLEEFFSTLEPNVILSGKEISEASDPDAIVWAKRGLFCFDVDFDSYDGHGYRRLSTPVRPLHISELPNEIQLLLKDHIVDINSAEVASVTVNHAY